MKSFSEYDQAVQRTAGSCKDWDTQLMVLALGVAGEAGEVADLVKKFVGHNHPLVHSEVIKELGDVLWYVSALAAHCNSSLEEVASANIAKLKKRYPEGFSADASRDRND